MSSRPLSQGSRPVSSLGRDRPLERDRSLERPLSSLERPPSLERPTSSNRRTSSERPTSSSFNNSVYVTHLKSDKLIAELDVDENMDNDNDNDDYNNDNDYNDEDNNDNKLYLNELLLFSISSSNYNNLTIHPYHTLIGYSFGNLIIIWDWIIDKYYYLNYNVKEIYDLKFSNNGNYLISGDILSMCLIDCETFELLDSVYINNNEDINYNPNFKFDFCPNNILSIVINDLVTIWDYSTLKFIQLHETPITDEDSKIIQILALYDEFSDNEFLSFGRFVTLQSKILTFWKYNINDGIYLESQQTLPIDSKDEYISACINHISGFVLVLCKSKLFILQPNGRLISSLAANLSSFTNISSSKNFVYLGTLCGDVQVYKSESFSFDKCIPYQVLIRSKFEILTQHSKSNSFKHNVSVVNVVTNGRFLFISYSDGSLHVVDLKAGQIVKFSVGHFGDSTRIIPHPHYSNSFLTLSNDNSIGLWQMKKKLIPKFIDLPNAINPTQFYISNSNATTSVTSICLLPSLKQLAIGDSSGKFSIYNISSNKTVSLSDNVQLLNNFKLISSADFSEKSEITSISFTKDELYFSLSQRNGTVVICKRGPPISLVKTIYSVNKKSDESLSHKRLQKVEFLQDRSEWQSNFSQESNVYYLLSTTPNSQIIQLIMCTSLRNNFEVQILHQFSLAFLSTPSLPDFYTSIELHPSENYTLVSTNKGRVCVFHLQTGESRGFIHSTLSKIGLSCIDPSGLYIALAGFDISEPNTTPIYNKLVIYEIGTGNYVCEYDFIKGITSLCFSCNGHLLNVSAGGSLLVFKMPDETVDCIDSTLNSMKESKYFWSRFPIFLPMSIPLELKDENLNSYDMPLYSENFKPETILRPDPSIRRSMNHSNNQFKSSTEFSLAMNNNSTEFDNNLEEFPIQYNTNY